MSFTMQDNGLGLAPGAPCVIGIMGLHAEEEGAAGSQVLNGVELVGGNARNQAIGSITFLIHGPELRRLAGITSTDVTVIYNILLGN